MPVITFQSGQLQPEIRDRLIVDLTETAARVTGIPKDLFIVSIHELPDDSIAVGGVTVAEVKRRLAQQGS